MVQAQQREPWDIVWPHFATGSATCIKGALSVARVPQDHHVEQKSQCGQLIFLPFLVVLG